MNKNKITWRSFVWGAFFAAFFAVLTVYIENRHNIIITSTQIPVLPYLLVIVTVLLINPFCRLIRVVRAFNPVEIMIVFIMGMVSAGLSTFGLSSQLVPIAGNLFNSEWNNRQSEWNRYVVPYLNERYFVAEPGIQKAAVEYKDALSSLLEKKIIYESAGRVSEHNKLVATAENKLLALEQPAFDQVMVLRRGLPRDRRAYPGMFPMAGDNFSAWLARLKRLIAGLEALDQIKRVWKSAASLPAETMVGPELAAAFQERFGRAAKVLAGLTDLKELENWQALLRSEEKGLASKRVALSGELRAVSERKGKAGRRQALELNDQADAIIGEIKKVDGEYQRYKTRKEYYHRAAEGAEKIQALQAGIVGLQKQLAGAGLRAGELKQKTAELMRIFPSIDVSLRRYFLGEVPWHCWLKPLSRWALLIGLTYIALMALNVLIFRQWAHNERLTYPLVELSKSLIGEPACPPGPAARPGSSARGSTGLPAVFRNGLFWIGAAVAMSVLGWNLLCATQIVPGLAPLDLANGWAEYVDKTQFNAWGSIRSEIFFTVIGLSFLVPKNISFSLWFFYMVYMAQLLGLVTAGYGQDARSFPWDWWYLANFRSAEAQGALIIFSSYVLYKCRKYILCAFFPASVAELEASERAELRISSIAFLGCSLGLILLLWLSLGANLIYAVIFYAVILVITIGLIRAVAEGGLLTVKAYINPIHYVRNFFGLNHSWTSAALFAPLMVYYAILFLDIKAFIAPAMANALKLREDYGVRRLGFHVAVALAIVASAGVAIAATIMMCYSGGADMMQSWFHTGLPRNSMFEIIASTIKDAPPVATDNIGWTTGGAGVMAGLLFFRKFYFWLPHPIGFFMLLNPAMDYYWFSIFLGWLCNVAVTKYGNKDTFHRAKGFFIGLIVGELIMVLVSFFVAMAFGTMSGIDLNRS